MPDATVLAEVFRGPLLESVHLGHAVIARPDGSIVESWGDPDHVTYPRSSAKMIQALPLMESGAGTHLTSEQLALACASHSGERRHVEKVARWLADLGLDEHALCCGPQESRDEELARAMIRHGEPVTRLFNNCSGKHAGFLTLTKALGAGPDYVDPDHPVQTRVKAAFEEVTGLDSPCHGIDGCSAPNFATTIRGLARAMAQFAEATGGAKAVLRDAMIAHPELVSGRGRACAALMQAAREPVAIKTGAEGVFIGILPKQHLGIALKVGDGATRASEAAIAALLVRLGAADAANPTVARYLDMPLSNWDGLVVGAVRPSPELLA
jgi:L-asparaginase II